MRYVKYWMWATSEASLKAADHRRAANHVVDLVLRGCGLLERTETASRRRR